MATEQVLNGDKPLRTDRPYGLDYRSDPLHRHRWAINPDTPPADTGGFDIVVDDGPWSGLSVCSVGDCGAWGDADAYAADLTMARMIAAAPALLELAEKLAALDPNPPASAGVDLGPIVDDARAIASNVTGGLALFGGVA